MKIPILSRLARGSWGLFGFLIFFSGCFVGNYINSWGLTRDIKEFVRKYGAQASEITCEMHGALRTGTCTFQANAIGVRKLVQAIKGKRLVNLEEHPLYISPYEAAKEGNCLAHAVFANASKIKAYEHGFVGAYRLNDKSSFPEFVIFQRIDSNAVCLDISY